MPFPHSRQPLALAVAALLPLLASAASQAADSDSGVRISAPRIQPLPTATSSSTDLATARARSSDTAQLLADLPGLALSSAGGVSSLPVIHGLADDRNRILIDGVDLISACGNHMNPPLSYIDPSQVGSIRVYPGIAPVSLGGNSIGGTIVVSGKVPRFAAGGELLKEGEAGAFYRSNGNGRGINAQATLASDTVSLNYQGATAQAGNYQAAADFKPGALASTTKGGDHWLSGKEVGSTAYKTENHALNLALRQDNHLLTAKLAVQHTPYQGFPNQHMDMTDNRSNQVNLGYTGQFAWGALEARLYHERTRHKMDFADDKLYWYGASKNVAGMPMDTEGRNSGAQLKADLPLNERDRLKLGAEFQQYRLSDWWTPVANSMMMSPNTFQNINGGQRDRNDLFAEWEAQWTPQWLTLAGLRGSAVKMNSGNVQGYNTSAGYATDAARFNASNRQKTDHNLDLTALARYTPDAGRSYEGGYARKSRSPSLYERYTWSTNGMAMTMNNWLNDGNGYVGSIDLKPEVAHTLSLTASWHDAGQQNWAVNLTPYVSHVDNYIDAQCRTTCTANRFNYLQLVNQQARLSGLDLSGFAALGSSDFGDFLVRGVFSYVNGKNTSTGDHLYNIMPANAKVTLEQRLGNWRNSVEGILVGKKSDVSQVRNEMHTAGYGLFNLRSSYEAKRYRVDIGLDNLFNKGYALPLGGAYIGQGTTMSLNGAGAPYGVPLPGMGRSLYAGVNVKF